MSDMTRRDFTRQTVGSLLTFSLLETLFAKDAFGAEIKPVAVKWLNELNDMCADLKSAKLGQLEWQTAVEKLAARVELPELLKLVNFEQLTGKGPLPDNGARAYSFKFAEIEGAPAKLIFGKQIFGMKKDRSVVPHGHDNMATAFIILKGDFHGRHYDRLEDVGEHIIIKPTIDRTFTVAEYSTISDEKDNIHWFKAKNDGAYIFNIHVLGLGTDKREPTGRVYLDPEGEKLAEGKIRAKRISYKDAHKLYG